MCDTFPACFDRLEQLSSEDLDRSVVNLVQGENRSVAMMIAHLAEISRRKVDLVAGYRNLFDYCVRRLGLSEGSVALRIQVANVARRFPDVLLALAEGRISLSVAGRLARHLREDNSQKLLAECAGMTKRGVEEYLIQFDPQPIFGAAIRKRPDHRPAETVDAPLPVPASTPTVSSTLSGVIAPATPEIFNFRFAASAEFRAKLERLAEVVGVHNAAKDLAKLLEQAVDLALEKKDPQRRLGRRQERARKREPAREEHADSTQPAGPSKVPEAGIPSQAAAPAAENAAANSPAVTRHVPAAVRDRVLERAGYQCQYTSSEGTRCTARTCLEIEHTRPFAIHRSHDEDTLEVLCAHHNRLRAGHAFGSEHVNQKIAAARASRWTRARVASQ